MKRNSRYEKAASTRESKLLFIFCEGERRENDYFYYFNRQASQVVVQLFRRPIDGNHSPTGLYNEAVLQLIIDKENKPEYELRSDDEVWFVIDTDSWGEKISELRETATERGWQIAQSNPCFEIWLYYHFFDVPPNEKVNNWKTYLSNKIPSGFDSRKHPAKLRLAVQHAEANYAEADNQPLLFSTQVFRLGKVILNLVTDKIVFE